jgi:hypothetical protein
LHEIFNRDLSLISPTSWFGARASANATLVSTAFLQPLLRGKIQLSLQFWCRLFAVNEIAETASDTSFAAV